MTEASPMLLYPPVDGWKSGSAGILSPNTICKVGTVKINYLRKKQNVSLIMCSNVHMDQF